MSLTNAAIEVLRTAERDLVALANAASLNRDYGGATSLLEVARRVKGLVEGVLSSESAIGSGQPLEAAEPREVSSPPKLDMVSIATSTRVRKSEYPKFLRDGETLVKVGWSKSEKSEYEHKCPRKVLLALCHSLANAGAKGRRFSMDKLLPLCDMTDETQLPDYQCYLSLAWLRQNGLVIQHGRQGYSLPKKGDLIASVESFWDQLPVRS